ncbi:YpmS family protein [Streptococcus dentapri]|uniref:YpmS family protein n=1 Tax=Streptococcus dentapri TaxID=573564 RepID=A0ABV8D1H6_9STRE
MKQRRTGKKNVWKWGFLALLAFNIALVGVVLLRIGTLKESTGHSPSTAVSQSDVKVGTFTSSRDEVNSTVASYLEQYQTKNNSYSFTATSSDVLFEGTYTLLGYNVPLYVHFTPVVLDDGSIQLDVSSVSAGTLSLPVSDVLKFIASSYDLPSFVEVDSKKSAIILNLPKMDNEAGIYVKATDFNLVNDRISFDIYKKKG